MVSGSLDQLGVRHQAMREYPRPLYSSFKVTRGRARSHARICIMFPMGPTGSGSKRWIACYPGEVAVIGTQKSLLNAPWRELLSTASWARGARGAIVDGLARDVHKIEEVGFPVFASGIKPVDSRSRGCVTAYNERLECGEVLVHRGEFIFADFDGVVIVAKAIVAGVMELASERVRRENSSRAALKQGAYRRDVFQE